MLVKNGVVLNYSDATNPDVVAYKKKAKEIKAKHKFPLVFKTSYPLELNASGLKEPFKSIAIPMSARHINDEGIPENWIYTEAYADSKGKIKAKRKMVTRTFNVNERDMELAIFLLYYSDFVKDGTLQLVNKQRDAQKKVLAKEKMVQTRYLLFVEGSPIYNDEERIRTIAASFGIGDARKEENSIDEIKLLLEQVIENAEVNGDKERDEKAFVKALDMDEITKEKAFVQEAIDKGIIAYHESKFQWVIISKGSAPEKICSVNPVELNKKEETLIHYLRKNLFYKEAIETRLEQGEVFGNQFEITEEWIDTAIRKELLQRCKYLGVHDPMKKKDVDLRAEMKEALKRKKLEEETE